MNYQIVIHNQQIEIDATRRGNRLLIERDGQQIELRVIAAPKGQAENNQLLLEHQGRILRIAGNRNGDQRQLWVNGRQVNYRRVTEEGNSAETAQGSLSASIPAVVSEILVAEGDSVQAGDKLILLESMKMIIPIQAPYAGVVGTIRCAAGDSVQPNIPLIVIDNKQP